jgi:hypothetical protein
MPEVRPALAQRAIEAYGGEEWWRAAKAIECRLSAHGWAFRLKLRPAVRNVLFRIDVQKPHVVMEPWDKHDNRAVFDGEGDQIRLESPDGRILATRDRPRGFFPGGRRTFRWDGLDAAYFSGYASWNYTTLPHLLLRDDITWQQVSDTTLDARFSASIPTHSQVQRFHFDPETGLLRQHDYTADVFGNWAAAANVVLAHGSSGGIPYASRRRVTPRAASGHPRGAPLLVGIEITEWRLVEHA